MLQSDSGAPFEVVERETGRRFLAQMKPVDEELQNNIQMHNMLDFPDLAQLHQAVEDKKGLAFLVYENADRSFLESIVAPGRRSVTPKEPIEANALTNDNREHQVQVFLKQLLTALQYMHNKRIAHLDLRPEVILLQDDHLRLADFGQSRHMLCGKASGNIKSNPEFVAPEIVTGRFPITLAADMWSVGVLAYVLLFGQSPFIGDNDEETLQNVVHGEFNLNIEGSITSDAKDFINQLLFLEPYKRMNADQALQHIWLDDPDLGDAKLSTDCLREFKYQHKWLERRVFVQQTPSDHLIQMIEAPIASFYASSVDSRIQSASQPEPLAIYDYLKIKEESKSEQISKRIPTNSFDSAFGGFPPPRQPFPSMQPPTPEQIVEFQKNAPPVPDWIKSQLPSGVNADDLIWDLRYGGFYLPPEKHPPIPPHAQPRSRSASVERGQQSPRIEPISPELDQKIQSAILAKKSSGKISPVPPHPISALEQQQMIDEDSLIKLIKGEKRPIQEEIANRVLSDISEEGSMNGSIVSSAGPTIAERKITRFSRTGDEDVESVSTTTQMEEAGEPSSGTVTPIPESHNEYSPPEVFVPEVSDEQGQFSSKNLPLNRSMYLDEHILRDKLDLESNGSCIGKKSQILLSSPREYAMNCVIGSDKQNNINVKKNAEVEALFDGKSLAAKAYRPHLDVEFDILMATAERLKSDLAKRHEEPKKQPQRFTISEELEKYRPKNFFSEDNARQHKVDPDDFSWESEYQIGPDTMLLPTRGPEFNARVRDYRRELWGDGALYVTQGILGLRNADITVRERRRYTDLIREDATIAKSVDIVNEHLLGIHQGSRRRVQEGGKVEEILNANSNGENKENMEFSKNNASSKFSPIFRSRLKDSCFLEDVSTVTLECQVIGNPIPDVTFFHHDSALVTDGRHQILINGEISRLVIKKPIDRVDTGEYSCVAVNEIGRDKCTCKLICGDALGRTSRPDVELSADTEVYISWEPPERIPVTLHGISYRLEVRQASEDGSVGPWTVVSDRIDDEAVVLKHLHPMGIYQFRVTPRNEFGWGDPSITSRIIRTHPRGVPKFNLDLLRREGRRFAVVATPQKSGKRAIGLTEICEEFAEEEKEALEIREEDEKTGNAGASNSEQAILLNCTEDPMKRFQLETELFRGHFSVIRYAIDSKSGAHCTVKIRAPPTHGPLLFATPVERSRSLLSEYETLVKCQHENVVELIAAYHSNNSFLLLFTERLYENVFQRFEHYDSYNEEQICVTIRQLASALRWIHYQGVVHLDVEPANVMFTAKRSWIVKLIDFGRARQVNAFSLSGNVMAKSAALAGDGQRFTEWTAPEVIKLSAKADKSKPSEVTTLTTQTDMWGLGLVTFCLLSGCHPFADENSSEQEVRESVLNRRCDPNLIPVQASEESLRFVTWALKKDPNRRMRPDEALNHRFLASDIAMTRRRQNVEYNSIRLRRLAERRRNQQNQIARNGISECSPVANPKELQRNGKNLNGNVLSKRSVDSIKILKNHRLAALI